MKEYLHETYNGSLTNMLENSVYYCYTIKDKETGKYYSGSRGVEGVAKHDLLTKYFTSSSVIDFKEKLKRQPELFEVRVEYFESRVDAFMAEKMFHQTHQVGKNKAFINSATAGGSNCGAGTVLCKDENGNIYRVSVEEFSKGNHRHVSKGMMNIRTESGIKKIHVGDFDPLVDRSEFKDYVLALNTHTGITCRIPKSVFYSDEKYVGITKSKVIALDTVTNERVLVSVEDFNRSNGRYIGHTRGLLSVIDLFTGEKVMIERSEYDKERYIHYNTGNVVVYSLSERRVVKVSKEEYRKNSSNYANQTTMVFYEVDGHFFKSKKLLDEYYRKTRGKTVLGVKQFSISEKFKDVRVITKEEHKNGKN